MPDLTSVHRGYFICKYLVHPDLSLEHLYSPEDEPPIKSHSKLSKRRKSGDAKPSPPAKRSRLQPANLDEYDLMQTLLPLFVLNPRFCTVFIAIPLMAYSLLTYLSKES